MTMWFYVSFHLHLNMWSAIQNVFESRHMQAHIRFTCTNTKYLMYSHMQVVDVFASKERKEAVTVNREALSTVQQRKDRRNARKEVRV